MRWLVLAVLVLGCGGAPIVLNAPECAPATARTTPTRVDLEPIAPPPSRAVTTPEPIAPPGFAAVLTSGMTSELRARALQGSPEGFSVSCSVDRFGVRTPSLVTSSHALTTMYVDLSCAAERRADHAPVWRGELRAREASTAAVLFAGDRGSLDNRVNRMFSDAARELASDLAIRALGLVAAPSARVFHDDAAARLSAGLDDSSLGAVALIDAPSAVPTVLSALRAPDLVTRATAWNVFAMATGPGEGWLAESHLALDDDPYVRFHQYKALARLGSTEAMAQLHVARAREDEPLLVEFIDDSIASGGIGVAPPAASVPAARGSAPPTKASAPTNGATTRP
jgi:hypothetical protein